MSYRKERWVFICDRCGWEGSAQVNEAGCQAYPPDEWCADLSIRPGGHGRNGGVEKSLCKQCVRQFWAWMKNDDFDADYKAPNTQ